MTRSHLTLLVAVVLCGCRATLAPGPPAATEKPHLPDADTWQLLGETEQGREVVARTLGSGPSRLYLIGGIHGDERPGGENIERVIDLLLDSSVIEGLTVRVVRDLNPDGTAHVMRRNMRGIDLNRNWPASNFRPGITRGPSPLSELETQALYPDLLSFHPDVVVVFHAARSGPFGNYDGPARELAEAFARGTAQAEQAAWRVQADMGYPTPGSLGSLVGLDWDVPILTLEFVRGQAADEAWPSLRAGLRALLQAIQAAPQG